MSENNAELIREFLGEFRAFRDTEFREFRADLAVWQRETAERLAETEREVKSGISGNGQPSRLKIVEDAVDVLKQFRSRTVGAAAAVGTIAGSVITVIFNLVMSSISGK